MKKMPELKLLGNKVLVHNMKSGERIIGSIILANDDGKPHGIRPRWAQVFAVGPDVKTLEVGDWVLIAHGRWTRKLNMPDIPTETPVHGIEYPESVLLCSKTEPADDMIVDSTEHGKMYRV